MIVASATTSAPGRPENAPPNRPGIASTIPTRSRPMPGRGRGACVAASANRSDPAPPTTWSFARGIFSPGSISRECSHRAARAENRRVEPAAGGVRAVLGGRPVDTGSSASSSRHSLPPPCILKTKASTATTVCSAPGRRPRPGRDETAARPPCRRHRCHSALPAPPQPVADSGFVEALVRRVAKR